MKSIKMKLIALTGIALAVVCTAHHEHPDNPYQY